MPRGSIHPNLAMSDSEGAELWLAALSDLQIYVESAKHMPSWAVAVVALCAVTLSVVLAACGCVCFAFACAQVFKCECLCFAYTFGPFSPLPCQLQTGSLPVPVSNPLQQVPEPEGARERQSKARQGKFAVAAGARGSGYGSRGATSTAAEAAHAKVGILQAPMLVSSGDGALAWLVSCRRLEYSLTGSLGRRMRLALEPAHACVF